MYFRKLTDKVALFRIGSYLTIAWVPYYLTLSTDHMDLTHGNCNTTSLHSNSFLPDLTDFSSHCLQAFCSIVPPVDISLTLDTLSDFFKKHLFTFSNEMDLSRARYVYGPSYPYNSSVRTDFTDINARIYAWSSRGGVIVLDAAEVINFEFLGLDPLDPPLERLVS